LRPGHAVGQLSRKTGIPFKRKPGAASSTLAIVADHGREGVQKVGEDESYELSVDGSGAKLSAPNPLGILHGLQTFLQLVEITPNGFAVSAVVIKDQPRFPWRGLLIDVSRHFIPLEVLKRNIDGMAAVKMNVLHCPEGFRRSLTLVQIIKREQHQPARAAQKYPHLPPSAAASARAPTTIRYISACRVIARSSSPSCHLTVDVAKE
jgi:hypothetical protein